MLIAQRPSLAEDSVNEFRSRFTIEPLEPGFGYTIGNSVRRTLLSSIPGAAVTSIRIEGVLDEFSTVPRVHRGLPGNLPDPEGPAPPLRPGRAGSDVPAKAGSR